jgi:hypothetical protein
VNEPCASQVLTSNSMTSPAPSNNDTRMTNGVRPRVLRCSTTRNDEPARRGVAASGVCLGSGVRLGRVVGAATGCALTRLP